MRNTVQFLEDYLKEKIISTFAAEMVLAENKKLTIMRQWSKPILTLAQVDGNEDQCKFCLTNLVYYDHKNLICEKYNLTGIISLLNDGRIIVTEYDIVNN